MKTFKNFKFKSESKRLIFKTLDPNDDLKAYLSFINNKENKYIHSVELNWSLELLKNYIDLKNYANDAILLGIFDLESKLHIGNIKFEPINFLRKYSIMGILIGNPLYRGKEIAKESIEHLYNNLLLPNDIQKLILGVDKLNQSAIKAYLKTGFRFSENPILSLTANQQEMVLHLIDKT